LEVEEESKRSRLRLIIFPPKTVLRQFQSVLSFVSHRLSWIKLKNREIETTLGIHF
jgi:hypothetical protein